MIVVVCRNLCQHGIANVASFKKMGESEACIKMETLRLSIFFLALHVFLSAFNSVLQ